MLTRFGSMRYSRMLEESSFANRKADYVWLLILSSIMLLVRVGSGKADKHYSSPVAFAGSLTTSQPPLPLVTPCICPDLPLVTTASSNADIAVWPDHDHCTISAPRVGRSRVGAERDLACGCWRPSGVCHWARRMVRSGCLGARDDWWPNMAERGTPCIVRLTFRSRSEHSLPNCNRKRMMGEV